MNNELETLFNTLHGKRTSCHLYQMMNSHVENFIIKLFDPVAWIYYDISVVGSELVVYYYSDCGTKVSNDNGIKNFSNIVSHVFDIANKDIIRDVLVTLEDNFHITIPQVWFNQLRL